MRRRFQSYALSLLVFLFSCAPVLVPRVSFAAAGVPKAFSYQGRLYDASGNLLGGSSGTTYCFKFSLWDGATVGAGSRLWPASSPTAAQLSVRNGVFSANIGIDTPDALTYNFYDSDTVYLQVEVATYAGSCGSYETLSPRKQLVAAPYAINSGTVGGAAAGTGAGNVLKLDGSGNINLSASSPQVNATGSNALTLQGGGGTGDVQFFNSSNKITSSGAATVASLSVTGSITAGADLSLLNGSGIVTASNASDIAVNGWLKLGSSSAKTIRPAADSTTALSFATSGGTKFVVLDSTNQRVGIGSASAPVAQLHVQTTAVGTVGLIVQAISGQTADLERWLDSTGGVLASVDASGGALFGSVSTTSLTSSGALAISSASNGNITIYPNGSGSVKIGSASNNITIDASGAQTNNGTASTDRSVDYFPNVSAADPAAVHAAITCTGGTLVVSTGITQPDVPRTLSITDTTGDGTNGQVTVSGVLADGSSSSENITITDGGISHGQKAFASVASITLPASCASTSTISVGTDDKLGLSNPLHGQNTVYKVNKNATDIAVPTVNTTTSTVDFSTITTSDAFSVWYKY